MFLPGNNKSSVSPPAKRELQNQMVEAIRCKCYEAQQELATYLQKKSEKLSAGVKRACLICFCLIGSAGCVLMCIQSWKHPSWSRSSHVQLRIPVFIQPFSRRAFETRALKDSLSPRIKLFHAYMDSLSQTAAGRIIHDSILAARPGLMDSVVQAELILHK